jgi:hypothetical protein
MGAGGIRAERMDPADVAWLHMDRPTNLVVKFKAATGA